MPADTYPHFNTEMAVIRCVCGQRNRVPPTWRGEDLRCGKPTCRRTLVVDEDVVNEWVCDAVPVENDEPLPQHPPILVPRIQCPTETGCGLVLADVVINCFPFECPACGHLLMEAKR